jgi:hypothetical protein
MTIIKVSPSTGVAADKVSPKKVHPLQLLEERLSEGPVPLNVEIALPVVTRFFCPPEIPLRIASPISVSAQISRPINC